MRYNTHVVPLRTISSVGQSHRLITGRSKVRALDGPPKNPERFALVTIKKFMDIGVMGEERRIVADDSDSIRLFLSFQTA